MSYDRNTYKMNTFTLVVPSVDNTGVERPEHLLMVRSQLQAAGFNGWMETAETGFWNSGATDSQGVAAPGKLETGTLITIYVPQDQEGAMLTADVLGRIGRRCMPDQEAVQVTVLSTTTTLVEA